MNRREVLVLGGSGLVLVGCGGLSKIPEVPVAVTVRVPIPEELKEPLADLSSIIAKVDKIADAVPQVIDLVNQGKEILSTVSGENGKSSVGSLLSIATSIASFLPPPYGTIASAIRTLLPIIGRAIGTTRLGRQAPTGLTPDQARQILRS